MGPLEHRRISRPFVGTGNDFPRMLEISDRPALLDHFLKIEEEDPGSRFGKQLTEDQVQSYVNHVHFQADKQHILGVYDDKFCLVGVCELNYSTNSSLQKVAELSLSVLKIARSRGIAKTLFQSAIDKCRENQVVQLFMQFKSDSLPMRKIAIKASMRIEVDSSESSAFLSINSLT